MRINEQTRPVIEWLLSLAEWPDAYFDFSVDYFHVGDESFERPIVQVQASTREAVRRVRAVFPGVMWQKNRTDWSDWEYTAIVPVRGVRRRSFGEHGVKIHIYACKEAPPACKAIEEEVEVEKQVPVAFETVKVKEKRIRWECPEEKSETHQVPA